MTYVLDQTFELECECRQKMSTKRKEQTTK